MSPLPRLPLLLVVLPAHALAQTDIDPGHKHSWGENIGFMNWADAGDPDGTQGVRFHAVPGGGAFLSGFVWCENAGWLHLGDGTPADGTAYANTTGADSGVNIDPDGRLRGLAWGENVGWVNFDTFAALGGSGQFARYDAPAARFRGYAWGENIGWINLDNDEHYVGVLPACYADYDGNGTVNTLDFLAYLNDFNDGAVGADDCDGNGTINTLDFLCFLNAFNAGC